MALNRQSFAEFINVDKRIKFELIHKIQISYEELEETDKVPKKRKKDHSVNEVREILKQFNEKLDLAQMKNISTRMSKKRTINFDQKSPFTKKIAGSLGISYKTLVDYKSLFKHCEGYDFQKEEGSESIGCLRKYVKQNPIN